jgi:hypothetical protein
VATGCKDGPAGASAHAQAEPVGLGPTTVVRLEGALAHEVLRYCTAVLLCAEKWLWVRGGAGPLLDGVVRDDDQPQSEARATPNTAQRWRDTRAGENGRQYNSQARYGSQWARVKLVPYAGCLAVTGKKKPMLPLASWPCQDDTPSHTFFLSLSGPL